MTKPSDLLLSLVEHDAHPCFAFNINTDAFIYVNPAFYTFFQLSEKDLTAKNILRKIHPDDYDRLRKVYAEMRPAVLNAVKFRVQFAENKLVDVCASVLIEGQETNERVITGYVNDLSARENKSRVPEKTPGKKDKMLNTLFHDLAGTLASMQTYTLLLSRKTKDIEDDEINTMTSALEQLCKESVNLIRSYKKVQFTDGVQDLVKNSN